MIASLRARRPRSEVGRPCRLREAIPPTLADPAARGNRLFMDAVLWIARTGAPRPDVPRRFNRWAESGVLARVVEALNADADLESLLIDSTVIRAHQHAAGAERKG